MSEQAFRCSRLAAERPALYGVLAMIFAAFAVPGAAEMPALDSGDGMSLRVKRQRGGGS